MTSEQDFPSTLPPETTTPDQHPRSSAAISPSAAEQASFRPRRRTTQRATPATMESARDGEIVGNAEMAGGTTSPRRGRRSPKSSKAAQNSGGGGVVEDSGADASATLALEHGETPKRGRAKSAPAAPAEGDVPVTREAVVAPDASVDSAGGEKTVPASGSRRERRPAAAAVAVTSSETVEAPTLSKRAKRPSVGKKSVVESAPVTLPLAELADGSVPGGDTAAAGAGSVISAVDHPGATTPEAAPRSRSSRRGRLSVEAAGAEVAASEAETSEVGAISEAEAGETAKRKNRRGRRGGRGRGHKNRMPEGQDNVGQAQEAATVEGASPTEKEPEQSGPEAAGAMPIAATAGGDGDESSDSGTGKKISAKKGREKSSAENKRMFISVLPGEQVEVALVENGVLLEYYLDMLHQRKLKGNIYKGIIHNIDANLQAAFVNYGTGKNGFLQIDEVHPEYWQAPHEPAKGKKFPPIQKVLKAGQEVLVQVVKEPTGSKGAFLTTWLSLAGRFLVLTPGQEQIGVSRKVSDEEERARLREMMNGIDPGSGLGVIVRTVSVGTTKATLKNDLQYLKRLWRDIRKKATEVVAPALVHQEPGLSERSVRDYLTDDVGEIWVDNEAEAENVRGMVSLLFPRKKNLVHLHDDFRQSLWDRFNLRRQLEQIYSREVVLPSGGRLVFDQTEALMAVDINSGKISGKGNFEAMAFKTNIEAAEAIARHLRLRDIGGQVVIDFIEMRDKKHVVEVEKTLRQAMKNDRARHDVARMSSFGLLELVRQRMGSSALSITLESCPACGGTGLRRNLEWRALQALRDVRSRLQAANAPTCVFETERELGLYLLNHKRDTLRDMEQLFGKRLEISIKP